MTANKKPEIELEVSCGGTFKISTDAMSCKITVLEKAAGQRGLPPVQDEGIAAPLPLCEPEVREVQIEEPFFKESVDAYCSNMDHVLENMAASVDKSLDGEGSAEAISARALPAEAEAIVRQRLAQQGEALARAQAKIVDQRFTLTFLKNHPIFSRRDPNAAEITVGSADLDILHAKIKSAMRSAVLINEVLAAVKEEFAGDGAASESIASISGMAAMQRQMIDAFCRLIMARETKEADPAVSFAAADQMAAERLAALQVEENPGEQEVDDALDLSDQEAIDRLLNTEAAEEVSYATEEVEMSDEEALRKMQEFGL